MEFVYVCLKQLLQTNEAKEATLLDLNKEYSENMKDEQFHLNLVNHGCETNHDYRIASV